MGHPGQVGFVQYTKGIARTPIYVDTQHEGQEIARVLADTLQNKKLRIPHQLPIAFAIRLGQALNPKRLLRQQAELSYPLGLGLVKRGDLLVPLIMVDIPRERVTIEGRSSTAEMTFDEFVDEGQAVFEQIVLDDEDEPLHRSRSKPRSRSKRR